MKNLEILQKIKNRKRGMTLVELIIGMVIFSLIMISVMASVHSMTVARIKNMNRIALTEELYFFSEQLFSEIKNGGTLDFEEYWNRKMVDEGVPLTTDILSRGHYKKPTGLGNFGNGGDLNNVFGDWLYLCRSGERDDLRIPDGKSCTGDNYNSSRENQSQEMQRYGQYALQFWDYNSNADNDTGPNGTTLLGDEDGDGEIVGDEDDKNRWNGPDAIEDKVYELYLTDKQNNTRTLFRWNITQDPNAKPRENCEVTENGGNIMMSDACVGNIQMLKLKGFDYGENHSLPKSPEESQGVKGIFDGKIDTWLCDVNRGWRGCGEKDIATGKDEEWVNLFSSQVNVRKFRLDVYPKKDPWLAAAAKDCESSDCISPFIHPYVRISLELGFSHGKRRSIRNENPKISISTTLSLDDFR